ncbi:hypothetical protein N7533_002022 [Penicillium manginii]|uniref:uncharacterized protein n=1 Tax=Penicillium manginii TaxID=203109 RepID=UPI002547C5CA|nr:uncharacterized protein N7533_002022 [Penicillium manginii]KAJ5763341.1 hypothetical protein N7533_002022 [Penicillium manginii]
MSPPDPFRHLLQKLMEAQTNRSNSTHPPPAPPPYSTNPLPPRFTMPELMSDIVYTDEPNPLAITIDATINVVGNNNTLALTSQPLSKKDTQTPEVENDASATVARKQDREAKAARLASVILKALQQADGLTDDQGRKRTVSVLLKCGVKVEGCNNEVVSEEDVNELNSCSLRVSSGGRKRAASVFSSLEGIL